MVSRFIRVLFYIGLALFVSCEQRTEKRVASFESMGTAVYVQPGTYISLVKEIFDRVDREMSEWKSGSSLSAVNIHSGKSGVICPDEVVDAVLTALSISKLTEGAFDPTWASMWHLWDFTSKGVPSKSEVNAFLPLINWKNVSITNNTILLEEEGMLLGLGGIAKGIALDKCRDALLEQDVVNFMIQAGGQVLAHGVKRVVGIRIPNGLPTELIGTATIQNESIATSGNYEHYFIEDGIRYHHIIDPKTGYPARGVQSVTVISQDATLADALSTSLFVMGVKDGITLIERLSNVEALFIDDNNVIHQSSGFTFTMSN